MKLERIHIHSDSVGSPKAKLITQNAKKLNPNLIVERMPPGRFSYPAGLATTREKYDWANQTLILRPRTERFIKTFASPGDIVEKFTTVLNLAWQCPHRCEYCYLQTTRPAEHCLYTNMGDMAQELHTAPYANKVALTIWSMLSNSLKSPLLKIPGGLRETTDEVRALMTDLTIRDDKAAMSFLYGRQKMIHEALNKYAPKGSSLPPFGDFRLTREELQDLYDRNSRFELTLILSEFTDLLGVDHLAGYTYHLLPLLARIPGVNVSIRSKSSFVDQLVKHDGLDRVKFASSLNTDHVIGTFEHGTATLDERLHAARRVQGAKGFKMKVVIEPIIRYDGFLEDYTRLIDRAFTELDPMRIDSISIGSVRYRKQLRSMILKHFPGTSLFAASQELQEPAGNDARMRYSLQERERIYRHMVTAIRKHSNVPITLGAESSGLWSVVGVTPEGHMGSFVAQFEEEKKKNEGN